MAGGCRPKHGCISRHGIGGRPAWREPSRQHVESNRAPRIEIVPRGDLRSRSGMGVGRSQRWLVFPEIASSDWCEPEGRSATPLREPIPKSEPDVGASRHPIYTAIPECRGARTAPDLPRFGYKNGYNANQEIRSGGDPCSRGERQRTSLHPPNLVFPPIRCKCPASLKWQ